MKSKSLHSCTNTRTILLIWFSFLNISIICQNIQEIDEMRHAFFHHDYVSCKLNFPAKFNVTLLYAFTHLIHGFGIQVAVYLLSHNHMKTNSTTLCIRWCTAETYDYDNDYEELLGFHIRLKITICMQKFIECSQVWFCFCMIIGINPSWVSHQCPVWLIAMFRCQMDIIQVIAKWSLNNSNIRGLSKPAEHFTVGY